MRSPYMPQFPHSESDWANTNRLRQFIKLDVMFIAAILSLICLACSFALLFVYGLSCDVVGVTSSLITLVITSWLSKLYSFLGMNNQPQNNRRNTASDSNVYPQAASLG